MRSIRRRILQRVVAILVAGSLLLGWFSYHDAAHEVEELFDAQLAQNARVLISLLQVPQSMLDHEAMARALVESADSHPSLGHNYETKVAYLIKDQAGQIIAGSFTAPDPAAVSWNPGFSDLQLDGFSWRAYVLAQENSPIVVWVGERGDIRAETVGKIVMGTLVPDIIGIPLMLLLLWIAIGYGLRPLEQLAQIIRDRDPDSLVPVVLADLPAEIEPMQTALNRLLHQLEQLLAREQRFIADAAHELRTPLAVMKVHLDNALSTTDQEQRDKSLQHLRNAVERSTRLVSQMLEMARLSDNKTHERVQVPVLEECRLALSEIMPLALQKNQDLQLLDSPLAEPRLWMDVGALKILILNLVGNAIRHTPPGGRITVSVSNREQNLCLLFDDTGPGIPDEDLPYVFERFFARGDEHGAGLGLSIVQRIVQHHRGAVQLMRSPLGGLRVQICFPVSECSK